MKIVKMLQAASSPQGDLAADSSYKVEDAVANELVAANKAELVSEEQTPDEETPSTRKRKKK
jgi:hypothetical protein